MIFFGTGTKVVDGNEIEGFQCSNCGTFKHFTFGHLKYFHLYWIPTLLLSKNVGLECSNCKMAILGKDVPKDVATNIKSNIFSAKQILPLFSGLFILCCAIAFMVYQDHQQGIQDNVYLSKPAVGDVYIVNFEKVYEEELDEFKYGAMRIKNIGEKVIAFDVSQYNYDQVSGVTSDRSKSKIYSDSYYDSESEALEIELVKLKDLKNTGAIFSINRGQ